MSGYDLWHLLTDHHKAMLSKAVEPGNHDQIRLLKMPGTGKHIVAIGNEIVASGEAAAQEVRILELWGLIREIGHRRYSLTLVGGDVGERIRTRLEGSASADKNPDE